MNADMINLDGLMQQGNVWRAGDARVREQSGIPTGFDALDAHLSGSGWPMGALTEILCDRQGVGELSLVLPALARLSHEGRWLAWIAPPHIPYAPALAAHGVDVSKVLVVHPRAEADMLWTVEQALRAGTCGAVLVWPRLISEHNLRRLQLAAEAGQSWGILFRTTWAATQASPAALRLRLDPTQSGGMSVRVLKRRGGWPMGPIYLNPDALLDAQDAPLDIRHEVSG